MAGPCFISLQQEGKRDVFVFFLNMEVSCLEGKNLDTYLTAGKLLQLAPHSGEGGATSSQQAAGAAPAW